MLKTIDLTRWAEAFSKIGLIKEIDQLQAEVNSYRPISKEIQERIFQKFRLDWNYNSNAIEGNKLSYGETVALLMHGVTAKGKPLKDHLDIKGHNEGISLLLDIVKSERDFNQNDIRSLHEIILVEPYSSKTITPDGIPTTRKINIGQYKTVPNHVKTVTGEMHYYATPEETPILMDNLMNWYEAAKSNKKIHPFVIASLFHYHFVSIHPFDDGNGRMARILMNLILMRKQYPPIVVPLKLREEYYGVLSQADAKEFLPMVDYFSELLKRSLKIQLKGIKGGDISEPDDVDKEIELFLKSFPKDKVIEKRQSRENTLAVINDSIIPLFEKFLEKCKKLDSLFFNGGEERIILSYLSPKSNKGKGIHLVEHDPKTFSFNDFAAKINDKQFFLVEKINFIYEWTGFSRSREPFNISYNFTVSCNTYNYYIATPIKPGRTFKKLYNEKMSTIEIDVFVKDSINVILEKIKTQSNHK